MSKVAILLGSESDLKTIEHSKDYYDYFGIEHEIHILSAHRNPNEVHEFSSNARGQGYSILIGGAGMAAHLAGAIKANSTLPVIGIPLEGGVMGGLDSLLSTVQMPKGVPVATMSIGKAGAINAAILCAEILSLNNNEILDKLTSFKDNGCKL